MDERDSIAVVRYLRCYYPRWLMPDPNFDILKAMVIDSIPTDPEGYSEWLASMRAQYAGVERSLHGNRYVLHDGHNFPGDPFFDEPWLYNACTDCSEIPRFGDRFRHIYIINLDHEVLTIDRTMHLKMDNIPRENDLWRSAICQSIYSGEDTLDLDICAEEHIAPPALELRDHSDMVEYAFNKVSSTTNIAEAHKVFITLFLARMITEYEDDIISFGREWVPDSFSFREMTFALVSIASGQARFYPSSGGSSGALDSAGQPLEHFATESGVSPVFGSMTHPSGQPPGASPMETIYWHAGVLVSLSLVVDGKAIEEAVTWGIDQGRENFQIVVLSLFQVAFAEVVLGDDGKPFVRVRRTTHLSPLREEYGASTHPRERPQLQIAENGSYHQVHRIGRANIWSNHSGTVRRLREQFPGLAALINFFDVAANRQQACKSTGIFPQELYDMIVDHVDYDTWNVCLSASTMFRSAALRKYRIDDRTRIVDGPFPRMATYARIATYNEFSDRVLSFDCEDMQTGEVIPMIHVPSKGWTRHILGVEEEHTWVPLIGGDRKILMKEVVIRFKQAGEDSMVEGDEEVEWPSTRVLSGPLPLFNADPDPGAEVELSAPYGGWGWGLEE